MLASSLLPSSIQQRIVVVIAALIMLATSAGCASRGPERFEVSGTVTLDGAPLADGDILFRPQPGTQAPTVSGRIASGEFDIPAEQGPLAGSYTVAITAERPTGRKVRADILGEETTDQYEQYLPPRYNDQTELTADVKSSRDDLAFELTSKK
jgi:hypothetical protein